MATDNKAVARYMYGRSFGQHPQGEFVRFTDHEQVVAELRAELAAKSAEVEGLRTAMFKVYCVAANGGKLSRLHIEIERMRNAMEKSND